MSGAEVVDFGGTSSGSGWAAKVRAVLDSDAAVDAPVRARFEEFLAMDRLTDRQIEWVERELAAVERFAADRKLLREVMDTERLTDREQEAFASMWEAARPLSDAQRRWLEDVADRLRKPPGKQELDAGIKPGSHYVPRDRFGMFDPNASALLPWERPGYEKPLKPPGRR